MEELEVEYKPSLWRRFRSSSRTFFYHTIQFPFFIWMAILAHMLEGFRGYLFNMKMTKFLNQRLLLTDIESSNIYAERVIVVLILAVCGGWVIDHLKIKVSTVIGFILGGVVYIVLSQINGKLLSEFLIVVLLPISGGLLVTPLHMAVDILPYTTEVQVAMKNLAFYLMYSANNFGDKLVSMLDPYISGVGGAHQYDLMLIVTGSASILSGFLMWAFFNPPHSKQVDTVDITIDYGRQLKKCVLFAISMCPVRTLFQYLDVLMSKYIERLHDSSWMANYGVQVDSTWIVSLNPLIVLFLAPIMGILLRNYKTTTVLIIGTTLSAISPLVMIFWRDIHSVVPEELFMILFSISESIYSARSIQLLMQMTPSGKKGLYSTISILPALIASGLAGEQAGFLLYYFCPSTVRQDYNVWEAESCQQLWIPIVGEALLTPIMLLLFKDIFNEPISKKLNRKEGLIVEKIIVKEEEDVEESSSGVSTSLTEELIIDKK